MDLNDRRKILLGISAAACAAALLAGALAWLLMLQPLPGIPSFEEVRAAYSRSEGILLDRNGNVIHEIRIDRRGRRLDWTALPDISPALRSAAIAAEDRRFYRHGGIDWLSLAAASWEMLSSKGKRGASTITMQLAAMQEPELRPNSARRSLLQKFTQMRAARGYEKAWSKDQILEAYLNLVTFRGELQGAAAAARGLFSKEPQGLNDLEAVILAALLRSPNAGRESVAARAYRLARVLRLELGLSEIRTVVETVLTRPYSVRPRAALAPHIARRLFAEAAARGESPGALSCTLDGELQAFAIDALRRHVLSVRPQNMNDGSLLVVDNRSGEVLAYVGNTGDQSSAPYVDGIQALRQAGSTLKPFIYALAFERRYLTPASLIDDSPLDIPVTGGMYRPRNYDNRFHGTVSARVSLASSLNVPAVKTLNLVGLDQFVDTLRRLGFREIRAPEFYGPSLALGSADVSLWDLVNAYRTLANGGVWSPLRIEPGKPASPARPVLSPEAVFLVSDILSDRESRSRTFDLESPLSTRFWTAVKTGTSKDMRDNWCVGFSARYTAGVWTGNFSGEPMWNVSGISGAAPVWIDLMNRLHARDTSLRPAPPSGVVGRQVDFPDLRQSRHEWFIRGTESARIRHSGGNAAPKIIYPPPGTIIALDPDIPAEGQKVFFQAGPEGTDFEWVLDGRSLGSASLMPWSPSGGKHVLKLNDLSGKELDSAAFEVRGYGPSTNDE